VSPEHNPTKLKKVEKNEMASNRSRSCYSGLIPPKQLYNEADLAAEQDDPVNDNKYMVECERCEIFLAYTKDGPGGPMTMVTMVRRSDSIDNSWNKAILGIQ